MGTVIPFHLTNQQAKQKVRDLARSSGNVVLTEHAMQRMEQRRLTTHDLFVILRRGEVTEPPALDVKGNWKVNVTAHLPGMGERTAVTVIVNQEQLIVVTVF